MHQAMLRCFGEVFSNRVVAKPANAKSRYIHRTTSCVSNVRLRPCLHGAQSHRHAVFLSPWLMLELASSASSRSLSASRSRSETVSSFAEPCTFREKFLLLDQDEDTADTSRKFAQHAPELNVSYFVGPCIPSLWFTNVLLLGCTVSLFAATSRLRSCADGSIYPVPPYWIWIICLPAILHQMLTERKALHLVKRCYKKHMEMHNLEPFELLGTPTWEVLWTLAQRLTLILGSLDLFTDTYFAGTMGLGGTALCSEGKTQRVWEAWWEHSIFRPLPVIPLDILIFVSWQLMLLQHIIACVAMLRRGSDEERDDGKSAPVLPCNDEEYLYNDDVFFQLSETAGFASITQISTKIYICQMRKKVLQQEGYRMMGYGMPLSSKYVKRVCLSYLLEDGVQVTLQSWTLAINTHQARERALLPMLSLCVSFLMGMVKLKEMMVFLGIRQLMENLASKTEREEHDAKDKDIEYFDSSLAAVRRHAICVKISMALMAGHSAAYSKVFIEEVDAQ
eukprot:s236_g43.t1